MSLKDFNSQNPDLESARCERLPQPAYASPLFDATIADPVRLKDSNSKDLDMNDGSVQCEHLPQPSHASPPFDAATSDGMGLKDFKSQAEFDAWLHQINQDLAASKQWMAE
eukprot:671168-Karenia_brevis.AAC.1